MLSAHWHILFAFLLAAVPAFPQTEPLRAGLEQVRQLSGTTPAVFIAALSPGDILHAVITQSGADIAATLRDPAGQIVFTADASNGAYGPETIAYLASTPGEYRLEVKLVAAATSGSFSLRVAALGSASPSQRELAAAFSHFAAAEAGRSLRTPAGRETALAEYPLALAYFASSGDRYHQAITLVSIGSALAAAAQFRPALDRFEPAAQLYATLGDQRRLAVARNFIGGMLEILGEPFRARDAYQLSLNAHRANADLAGEALLLSNLGVLEHTLGNWQAALSNFTFALPLVRATGDRRREALIQHNFAVAHLALGDAAEATALLNTALAVRQSLSDSRGVADSLTALGFTQLVLNQPAAAIPYFERALALQLTNVDKRGEAQTRRSLALALTRLGRYAEAEQNLQTGLSLSLASQDRRQAALALEVLAATVLLMGDPARALPSAETALAEFRAISDRAGEARALATLARIRAALGELAAARTQIDASIQIAEAFRGQAAAQDHRELYFATRQDDYEFYIDLLMRLSDPVAAFAVAERARARGLLDMLAEAGAGLRAGTEPAVLASERELSGRINALAARLIPVYGRREAQPILEAIRQLESKRRETEESTRRSNPRYAAATQPAPIGLARLQSELLDPGSVLLEYSLGTERSFVWAISKTAFRCFPLPGRAVIDAQANALLSLLPTHNRLAIAAAARALSDSILAPVAEFLTVERLLIVADGGLQRVPFAMLPLPGRDEPLVTTHESVSLPSASIIALLRTESPSYRPPTKSIAMFADPVFTGAPVSTRMLEHLQQGGPSTAGPAIPRLPFTRREAERIVRLTPKVSNLLALGSKANRAAALDPRLAGYRYVHFATHGYLDPERPNLSALLLSFRNEKNEPEDGYLRVHDIYNLRFNADLVVLSACQSGLGKEIRGEGLVGLPRAFLYAGAPRVVVSLWNVNDQATAELMTIFYRRMLKDHLRPAAALRQAQLALRKQTRWASPYYWAAFIQQGEWK